MKQLQLTKGYWAIVDDADYPFVSQWKWRALVRGSAFSTRVYAVRHDHANRKCILLHRLISRAPDGLVVDHINGNGLDNRRENLRACTHSENLRNRKANGSGSSGYKGVHRCRNKWKVCLVVNQKQKFIGVFDDIEEAARAHDAAAIKLHGQYARLNFPEAGAA